MTSSLKVAVIGAGTMGNGIAQTYAANGHNVTLVDMSQENPFEGVDELVKKLHEEGDEKETRQAWLEEISERAKCPVCGDNLHLKKMKIKCNSDSSHLSWP